MKRTVECLGRKAWGRGEGCEGPGVEKDDRRVFLQQYYRFIRVLPQYHNSTLVALVGLAPPCMCATIAAQEGLAYSRARPLLPQSTCT